jgi:L-seryl-tRNA(Ser) seleniumtransferase
MTAESEHAALRSIPSVDRVLRELGETSLPRPVVVAVIRRELDQLRASPTQATTHDIVMQRIRAALDELRRSRIQTVINGTGIIIHTNFGRSPLAPAAIDAMVAAGSQYNNLEYDLTGGNRGGRAAYLEHNLAVLCTAESATVVNNCAAALVLILRHFAETGKRKHVLISRGELVQIGGGFRVPEILEASGAILREVGTTNKTSIDDFRRVTDSDTAMILRVHRSNFFMEGFVDSPTVPELAQLAKQSQIPLVVDLGSGALFDTATLGGSEHEPTPDQTLREGADLVCFSGDKLLGGPQAGIIAGREILVKSLKNAPFFRALRCDKLILAALQATVDLHLQGASVSVPILAMMRTSLDALRTRAQRLIAQLNDLPLNITIGEATSQVGGGCLPRTEIPSITLDIIPTNMSIESLASRFRLGEPPIIGHTSNNRFKLDLRTIFDSQEPALIQAIRAAAMSP